MGAKGILTPEEIDRLIAGAKDHGGLVSYKSAEDGSEVPYEINITWYSALNKEDSDEPTDLQIKRFTASRAVALVLEGVPGIYLHGLLGTENDCEAVLATRSKRAINRTFIDAPALYRNLADPASKVSMINKELGRLLRVRTADRVFHPQGPQRVLDLSPRVFGLMRSTPERDRHVVTLTNVTQDTIELNVPVADFGFAAAGEWSDLVTEKRWKAVDGSIKVQLEPYGVLWLEPFEQVTV
jgi:sucrose phosphorylase